MDPQVYGLLFKENTSLLGQIPIVQSIREGGDYGNPVAAGDTMIGNAFKDLAAAVIKAVEQRNVSQEPTKKVEIKHK